jgi:hypothetical protein
LNHAFVVHHEHIDPRLIAQAIQPATEVNEGIPPRTSQNTGAKPSILSEDESFLTAEVDDEELFDPEYQ